MITKLQIRLLDGTTHWVRLPAGSDPQGALWALLGGELEQFTGARDDWLESEAGEWVRSTSIIACRIRSEDDFTLTEVMALSPREQDDFYTRHPVPDLHRTRETGDG